MVDLDQTPAWKALQQHCEILRTKSLADLVLGDPRRLIASEIAIPGIRLNYALQYVTPETIALLSALVQQQDLSGWRERMWRGDKINISEKRAVLHTALRQQNDKPVLVDDEDVVPDIRLAHKRMSSFVGDVREGRWRGFTGQPIRHIVNLGIGGSDLGPRAVVQALDSFASGPIVHFVANADAFDLLSAINTLDPAETLFVVVSKTFTTQETLLNATTARQWIVDALGEQAVANHFVAVSINLDKAIAFGLPAENMFPLWDWVGGRFSLWSSVGLSIALAIGMERFDCLLEGAAAMDDHFYQTPYAQNLPVMLALLGIWNRNFLKSGSLAVLPYSERLRELPRYLQQLEMESNGKSVTRKGEAVTYVTAPIIFGECGTVGQHSFHQWLHQGSEIIPVDFIGVTEDDLGQPEHHRAMLANMAAQAGALAFGQTHTATRFERHEGGRPSSLILLDRLDPYCVGLLISLYEHKVFSQGIIWDINSFDQPGVELGKKIAKGLDHPPDAKKPEETFISELFQSLS